MCPSTSGEFVTGLPRKVEFTSKVELMAAISLNCFFCLWLIFPAVGVTLPCIALNICPSERYGKILDVPMGCLLRERDSSFLCVPCGFLGKWNVG
jgi:hypothetical protein